MSSQIASNTTPAQPKYVLRGHAVPIHSLAFTRDNTRLLSGDANGFVVLWSLITKRPVVSWQAHNGPILGIGSWGDDRIITHGRNESLCVWRVTLDDEENDSLSKRLPVEQAEATRQAPWMLHRLQVSTLSFCSFASCDTGDHDLDVRLSSSALLKSERDADGSCKEPTHSLLIAVCGMKDTEVEIYNLPGEKQVALIPEPDKRWGKTGMVMALQLSFNAEAKTLLLMAAYESGRACVFKQTRSEGSGWQEIYSAQPHSQPILSLAMDPSKECFFTSSADAVIAKHPLSATLTISTRPTSISTHHAGQQGLKVRSDGKLLATAGWDARIRVYSTKSLKELAVLKWHKEGCYAIALGTVDDSRGSKFSSHQLSNQLSQTTLQTVAQSRQERVKETHWLAAGSKDGKITLWDIY